MSSGGHTLHLAAASRRDLSSVRHRVRDFAATLDDDGEWLDGIVLVVSELATNAIEYGEGGPAVVDAAVVDDELVLVVAADSTGIPIPPDGPVPSENIRGRGLLMVQAIANQVSIETTGNRVIVTTRFSRPN
ncbi:MAG: ATP-binding protein [Ilumatobacter sp.]|nr:ATP-binding protein [Ilumatobacter sp.]